MQVTTIGLDLAKNIFQVHGIDENGEVAIQPRSETGTGLGIL